MKISKKNKRLISYIVIPLIMAVLGYGIIYLTLHPVIEMASGVMGMVMADSAPNFNESLSTIYDEGADRKTEGEISMDEVEFPTYETHYAQLICERLDMDVRVYWGDTDEVFKEGAGQYIGSFIPGYGGPILIGAHDSLYFEPLEEVQEGDIFILRTNYGEFEYQVTETKIASANDDEVFDNTTDEEQLVLYTCYPFGALIGIKDQRFYVFADKISGPVISTE